jgi:hypothetical protein
MSTRARVLIAVLAAVAGALLLAAPARAGWGRPVAGPVARGFAVRPHDPFAPGQHRGADFAAQPGTTVRSACAGRVVVARRVGYSGGVVTVACGRWRVSLLPLARITVAEGETAWPGRRLGTVAPTHDHAGIHLGVRRAGDPTGYVDPLPFLSKRGKPTPGVAAWLRRTAPGAPGRVVGAAPRVVGDAPRDVGAPPRVAGDAPRAGAAPRRVAAATRALAPPLAWAGLGVLVLGAVGVGGVRTRATRTPAAGLRVRAAGLGGRLRS